MTDGDDWEELLCAQPSQHIGEKFIGEILDGGIRRRHVGCCVDDKSTWLVDVMIEQS